jgi:hypothetical protein
MGKGSNARPFEVPREEFTNNWDTIFGKKNKEQPVKEDESKEQEPKDSAK